MRLWSWLRGLGNSVTGSLVATGVAAGIAAVWSAVKWPWYVAVEVFVGAFVFVFFAINQISAHVERLRRTRRNNASPEEIRTELRNWLLQMRYFVHDGTEANFNFVITCHDSQNNPFQVFQNATAPSMVGIRTWMNITEDEHRRVIDRTPELFSAMRMEMARLGVTYSGLIAPVTSLTARVDLPWGEYFTAYVLQQGIFYVFRARAIMAEMILMELNKAGVRIGPPAQPQLPRANSH